MNDQATQQHGEKAVDIGSYKYIFCVDVNSVELTRKTGRLETGTNTTMADKYSLNPMFQKMAVAKSVLTHSPTKQLEAEGKQVRSLCVGDPDCIGSTNRFCGRCRTLTKICLQAACEAMTRLGRNWTSGKLTSTDLGSLKC
ncbi:hypothetical protein PR003_g8170 [Phytophthora rubi]|uniref:Uncharacterized protein n=1 Tax=Phytophthora rubi TaxID=129364 RepID=A0A6A4FJQ2_9STRA|nr:hypothetical protein PR003_g8170 [Phytophthora rubi]